MSDKILVLGGTGTVGTHVVNHLHDRGYHYVLGLRKTDATEAPSVHLDYSDETTFAPALEGINSIFMITPGFVSGIEDQFKKLIQAAEQAGVAHIVYSSVIGADGNPEGTHRQIELALEASTIAHTILRPNFYMQNFITYEGEQTKHGRIFLPTAAGKTSYLDVRDIAHVFGAVVGQEAHYGKTYTLTGSEALDNDQIAQVLATATGRSFENVNPSEAEYEQTLASYGVPQGVVDASKVLYSYIRNGYVAGVSADVETLTGKAPIRFEAFAQDFVQ